MPNYFDYMLEAANASVEEVDDINIVYNEMDATLAEFNLFVQEGVGLKILIGIGIAAALAGLIALIVKLFSKKNGKGAAAKASQTKNLLNIARQNGVTSLTVNLPKGFDIDKSADNTINLVNEYSKYVGKYVELVKNKVESMEGKQVTSDEMIAAFQDIGITAIQDFPELLTVVQKGKSAIDNVSILSKDEIKGKIKTAVSQGKEKLPIETCNEAVTKFMEVAKNLLKDGKETDQKRGILNKLLQKSGIKGKIQDKTFETATAYITKLIQSAYDSIDTVCDDMVDSLMDDLAEMAPEVAEKLKTGDKLSAFFGAAKNDFDKARQKKAGGDSVDWEIVD